MNKEDFKNLFLKLTEYTIPFGEEPRLYNLLPTGFKKDSFGNCYYTIGDSETLFTTHLDTYSKEYEKVNHFISDEQPYLIGTDGKTILGGDNKLGCSILISMIKDNIPGTYYFFVGEEPIVSGGLWGSRKALNANKNFFKKFKRCVAFDRRGYGSIVTRQMARRCCSETFATSISKGLEKSGIDWDLESNFGYYTDTAVFMDVIPECTNLSAGGFNEHHKNEWVNLNYTYKVYEFAKSFDWESLPVEREIEVRFSENDKVGKYSKFNQSNKIKDIEEIFDIIEVSKTRDFYEGDERHLTFSKWLEDFDFNILLKGDDILLNGKKVTIEELKEEIVEIFGDDILEYLDICEEPDRKKLISLLNL